jgi:hypothetical protein
MNINLHIERLVLDGLPIGRNQGPHVRAAVEAELTRLLAQNGMAANLQTGGAVPQLGTNVMQLSQGHDPIQMGTQIAHSVYSGIGNKE